MAQVIDLGAFRMTRKLDDFGRRYEAKQKQECRHQRVTLDDMGHIVECDDCGKQIEAFWYLVNLCQQWEEWRQYRERIQNEKRALEEDKAAHIHLIAARKVEKVWRSTKYVPCCPHCREPIFAGDKFGDHYVSKPLALRARMAKENKKEATV